MCAQIEGRLFQWHFESILNDELDFRYLMADFNGRSGDFAAAPNTCHPTCEEMLHKHSLNRHRTALSRDL